MTVCQKANDMAAAGLCARRRHGIITGVDATINRLLFHFYRATLCISAVFAIVRCPVRPSVYLSVTFVCCIQTDEDIAKNS